MGLSLFFMLVMALPPQVDAFIRADSMPIGKTYLVPTSMHDSQKNIDLVIFTIAKDVVEKIPKGYMVELVYMEHMNPRGIVIGWMYNPDYQDRSQPMRVHTDVDIPFINDFVNRFVEMRKNLYFVENYKNKLNTRKI